MISREVGLSLANQRTITGDPLRIQIILNHPDQVITLPVFRVATATDGLRIILLFVGISWEPLLVGASRDSLLLLK
jgi:hypothetical protein